MGNSAQGTAMDSAVPRLTQSKVPRPETAVGAPLLPTMMKFGVYYSVQWLRREPVVRCLRELTQTQFYSPEQLAEWQHERLRATVTHAMRTVPYYRSTFADIGRALDMPTFRRNFSRLPFLTKATLRDHMSELMSDDYRGPLSYKTTGGSTGEAVTIAKDRMATAHARGAMWRNYAWWGIDIGHRQGRFWGVPIRRSQRLRYRVIDLLSNRIRLSSFGFSDDDLRCYYTRLKRFKPVYLYGYASMIYEFAAFLRRERLSFSVPLVITTSEVLYPHQKTLIQEVLRCRVVNEYGCGELGPVASECPEGGLHLMADNLYIEILTPGGTPAAPGEHGEVVATELHSRAMPLIRYRLMDSVEVSDAGCSCGRSLPTIKRVTGRAYDYLRSPSGKRFHGEKVMYLLEHLKHLGLGVRNLQVRQTTPSTLKISVVPDTGFTPSVLEIIQRYFTDSLGAIDVEFTMVDQVHRDPSGKFRVVSSDLPD